MHIYKTYGYIFSTTINSVGQLRIPKYLNRNGEEQQKRQERRGLAGSPMIRSPVRRTRRLAGDSVAGEAVAAIAGRPLPVAGAQCPAAKTNRLGFARLCPSLEAGNDTSERMAQLCVCRVGCVHRSMGLGSWA
jgi:hypothetical protein